ncbi:MAG TPA: NUDIX hydrolase [Devosia sp.]|uniref:NUDIX hydrolase n=1 Tax=Devosia sp. TaxID=1871048 RepID=UPI002DDD5BB2|nr:NUDIX hydrolase [Devosia sp.]HEV2515767.1 NUDIX hydrolase [Devosia sp.]
MTDARQMLSFHLPGALFQMRAVAIIRHNGHVLLHRASHEQFWSLPGGRVELGETASETLVREMLEELGCAVRLGPLRFLVENLFVYQGTAVHEVGWYFEVELVDDFPFATDDVCHRAVDGSNELEFRWVRNDASAYLDYPLLPPMLPAQLLDPTPGFRHIIERQT